MLPIIMLNVVWVPIFPIVVQEIKTFAIIPWAGHRKRLFIAKNISINKENYHEYNFWNY